MKKPKMVANLLEVTDVSIETLEARARLHDSHNKGHQRRSSRKFERSIQRIMGIAAIVGTTSISS
jgi:hypothetical protein